MRTTIESGRRLDLFTRAQLLVQLHLETSAMPAFAQSPLYTSLLHSLNHNVSLDQTLVGVLENPEKRAYLEAFIANSCRSSQTSRLQPVRATVALQSVHGKPRRCGGLDARRHVAHVHPPARRSCRARGGCCARLRLRLLHGRRLLPEERGPRRRGRRASGWSVASRRRTLQPAPRFMASGDAKRVTTLTPDVRTRSLRGG